MANFIHLVKITVNTTFRCQNDRTYLAKARFLFFPRSISGKNNNNNNNKWVNMDSLQLQVNKVMIEVQHYLNMRL